MNEQIRELAERAGAVTFGGKICLFGDQDIEKFAELIVKECAKYVKNTNCFTYASQADLCAERMKQHFGVEE